MTKRGNCKICLKENVTMTKGHIIPDWVYRIGNLKENFYLKTENLQGPLLDVNVPKPTGSITYYLFCKDCDEWLGEGEAEIRSTFISPNSPTDNITSTVNMIQFPWYKLDVPKIKLVERGIAGIIYKLHFVNDPLFSECFIEDGKVEQYRKALLEGSSECDNFDFLNFEVLKLYDIGKNGSAPMSFFTIIPYEKDDGIALFMAGLCIIITYDFSPLFSKREDNKIKVVTTDLAYLGYKKYRNAPFKGFPNWSLFNLFQDKWMNRATFRTALKKYDGNAPCPCGLYRTKAGKRLEQRLYSDCCKKMWFSNI